MQTSSQTSAFICVYLRLSAVKNQFIKNSYKYLGLIEV